MAAGRCVPHDFPLAPEPRKGEACLARSPAHQREICAAPGQARRPPPPAGHASLKPGEGAGGGGVAHGGGQQGPENPVYFMVHPECVGDAVAVRHAAPGRLRLALRRPDPACLEAVIAALAGAGGTVERVMAGSPPSLVARYDPAAAGETRLLGAPLPPLPLPPARIGAAANVPGPAGAVWAALTAEEGPPWCPPAMLQVTPLETRPPSWEIMVRVGPWTLPHHMQVTDERPPRVFELGIEGKLNGVIRYDIDDDGPGRSHLRQRLWFAIDGNAAEVTMGEGIVQQFARRFADEQVRDITRRVANG